MRTFEYLAKITSILTCQICWIQSFYSIVIPCRCFLWSNSLITWWFILTCVCPFRAKSSSYSCWNILFRSALSEIKFSNFNISLKSWLRSFWYTIIFHFRLFTSLRKLRLGNNFNLFYQRLVCLIWNWSVWIDLRRLRNRSFRVSSSKIIIRFVWGYVYVGIFLKILRSLVTVITVSPRLPLNNERFSLLNHVGCVYIYLLLVNSCGFLNHVIWRAVNFWVVDECFCS